MKDHIKKWGLLLLSAALLITTFVLGTVQYTEKLLEEEAAREKPTWEGICSRYYPDACNTVVIADPKSPCALCSGLFAAENGVPLLFTDDPGALAVQLKRLNPKQAWVIADEKVIGELGSSLPAGLNLSILENADPAEGSAALAAMCSAPHKGVFLIPTAAGADTVAAVSGLSTALGFPVLLTESDGLCAEEKEYLSGCAALETIYAIGSLSPEVDSDLAELGKEIVVIEDKGAAAVNGRLNRMLMSGNTEAAVLSQAEDALALSCAAPGLPILYVPDFISAPQIFYLKENPVQEPQGVREDDPALLQARRVLKGIREQPFVFDTEQFDGAVFFVPHQDDETLYYSQTIAAAIDAYGSENVHVVLISDGATSGIRKRDEITQPVGRIVSATGLPVTEFEQDLVLSAFFSRARTNEMLDALRQLGITTQVRVCYFKDSTLEKNLDGIKGLMDACVREIGGRLMLFSISPYFDHHSDHRAVGQALYQLHAEDPDGTYGGVRFIVRSEGQYNEGFLSFPDELFASHAFFLSAQDNNERIRSGLEAYGTYDCNEAELAAGILQTVNETNCSLAGAVISSEAVASLRLAIGPQSMRDSFRMLTNWTVQNCFYTVLHDPFDIDQYGGIEHD